MKFSLSSSQQKELLIRGAPLLIAIPLQRDDDNDSDAAALQLAREWLLLPDGCRIVSSRFDEIEVAPQPSPTAKNLTTLLGELWRYRAAARPLFIVRHVVIMSVVRGPQERHIVGVPQWANGPLRRSM